MTYSYAIGNPWQNMDGAMLIAGAILNGTSTHFTSYLVPGDTVKVNGELRTVAIVIDDISILVDTAFTAAPFYHTGTYHHGLPQVNLETDLGIPAPKGLYTPYTQPITLGNGLVRGAGWKTAEWKWGFLSRANRQLLRAYCPGASAAVIIVTRTNENNDAFATFYANMIWPQQEDPQAGRRLDFSIKFQGLTPWP